MRGTSALMLGMLLLCGCTVPSDDDVILERLCSHAGREFQDATLQLTDGEPCSRGIVVEVRSWRYGIGCVRVALETGNGRPIGSTSLRGQTQVTPAKSRGLRILLAEGQETAFRLYSESFESELCTGTPSTRLFQLVDLPNGTVQSARLDSAGTDADGDQYASIDTGGTDCDDTNADVHPDNIEKCDGVDNDCDKYVDEGFNIGVSCTSQQGAKGIVTCDPSNSTQTICATR
ncbi:putative metal-binding motif-containing protein [Corallococcus exiguus]|uniref:putative metal-binding motif-containing protein n=1 Tax=Corallococcus exiguus TaxID=83462 RepID=UPI001A8EB1C5|nr:putative metal-binding motif-containing protein [Corallococcus exiguus]MBN8466660.1 putative metal-binding motif-containing protein [Corallococcus exiguus]